MAVAQETEAQGPLSQMAIAMKSLKVEGSEQTLSRDSELAGKVHIILACQIFLLWR